MSMNDPLGDMLTRIRNAQMRGKSTVRSPASKLRAWQQEALSLYLEKQPRDFLAVATPGAGKTTFALRVAAELLQRSVRTRYIGLVVLAVVQLHDLAADVRFESCVVVRELGERICCHFRLLPIRAAPRRHADLLPRRVAEHNRRLHSICDKEEGHRVLLQGAGALMKLSKR